MASTNYSSVTKVTFVNNGAADITVQLYRVNLWATVKAGDTLILKITEAEEAVYYKSLETDTLSVTIA